MKKHLLVVGLLFGVSIFAQENVMRRPNPPFFLNEILPNFKTMPDDVLIKKITLAYPEMEKLKEAAEVTAEGIAKKGCIAFRLYGVDAPEFDRTAVGILALKWLLAGDYHMFTSPQPKPILTERNFNALKRYTKRIVKNNDILDALIGFLVINDLGKVKSVVHQVELRSGIKNVDHDVILTILLERYPQMSYTYRRLSPKFKKDMLDGLKAEFNLAQFMQGESLPANLSGVATISEASLDLFNLHALFDIAGAAGHTLNCNSGSIINEATYSSFMEAFKALKNIRRKSLIDVYRSYLTAKAKLWGFNINTPENYAITRIALMLRTSDAAQLAPLKAVFDLLAEDDKEILIKELNKTGVNDVGILQYYSPALLANAQKTAGNDGIKLALEGMANIFRATKNAPNYKQMPSGVYTVNINALARQALGKEALTALPTKKINIRPVGQDGGVAE